MPPKYARLCEFLGVSFSCSSVDRTLAELFKGINFWILPQLNQGSFSQFSFLRFSFRAFSFWEISDGWALWPFLTSSVYHSALFLAFSFWCRLLRLLIAFCLSWLGKPSPDSTAGDTTNSGVDGPPLRSPSVGSGIGLCGDCLKISFLITDGFRVNTLKLITGK